MPKIKSKKLNSDLRKPLVEKRIKNKDLMNNPKLQDSDPLLILQKKVDKEKPTKQKNKELVSEAPSDPLLILQETVDKEKPTTQKNKELVSEAPIFSTSLNQFDDDDSPSKLYTYLDSFMNIIATFATFNYDLFMFLINSILKGADTVLTFSSNLVVPPLQLGYRITKRAMKILLNVYSSIFQSWVSGAVLYSLMIAFPNILYDNVTYVLGTRATDYILYPFKVAFSEIPPILNLDSPLSLVGMLSVGTILQYNPLVSVLTSNIAEVIYDVIGVPIQYIEGTLSTSMYNKWQQGGWKSLSIYLGSLLSGAGILWLVSPELLNFWRTTSTPQIFYDIQSYFRNSISDTTFTILTNFLKAITVSQIAVGNFIGYEYPVFKDYLYSLFGILTGAPITSLVKTMFLSLSEFFRGTSILEVLSGNVSVEPEVPFDIDGTVHFDEKYRSMLDLWYARFDPGIILFLSNLLEEAGSISPIQSYSNILKKIISAVSSPFSKSLNGLLNNSGSIETAQKTVEEIKKLYESEGGARKWHDAYYASLANLFNITRPSWYLSKIASWPLFQRTMAVYRTVAAAANTIIGAYIPSYKTLSSIVFGFFVVGVARWFIFERVAFDRILFTELSLAFATLSKIFNVIIEKDFDIELLDNIIESKNEDFTLMEIAIQSRDRILIYQEFISTCIEIRGKIIKLASFSPDNEEDEIIVGKTLPTFANSLVNFTTQVQLLLSNIEPRSKYQPDVDKAIETITHDYSIYKPEEFD
jgi:hypothetical protein